MKKQATVLENLNSHSVRFNDLYIPINAVERTAARYTMSLVALNDNETFPISLVASCTAVKYKGYYLALCTRHQLKGWELERIGLLSKDGHVVVTSGGMRHYNKIFETDLHDLAAFDFTQPCKELPELQERFFDLREPPPDTPSNLIVCLIASGYPFADQSYDLEDRRHLGQTKRIFLCQPDGSDQPRADSFYSGS